MGNDSNDSTASDLFKSYSQVIDSFAANFTCHSLQPSDVSEQGDHKYGGGSDCNVSFNGTLKCMGLSHKDIQDTSQKHCVFLFCYDLSLKPSSNVKMYNIVLRALDDSNSPISGFQTESRGDPHYWDGKDDCSGYEWNASSDPSKTLVNSVWSQTSPDSQDDAIEFSVSSSESYGGNIGLFGLSLTGGLDYSHTLSHTDDRKVIPVKISNKSNNDRLQHNFNPQQQKSDDFQPEVQGLLTIDDDGEGDRSPVLQNPDPKARRMALELRVTILPEDQVVTVHYTDTHYIQGYATLIPEQVDNERKYQNYHCFRRIIHVPLPMKAQ